MPIIEQLSENEAPQPIVLDESLARATTRNLVGKLETVAIGAQAVNLTLAAFIDNAITPGARVLLLIFAGVHAVAAALTFRFGGPFLRGGVYVVAWLGLALLMPILIAGFSAPGDYGSNPTCVQLCSYPAPPLVLFAFFPWLSQDRGYLRPALDIVLLAAVLLEPVFIIWHINGFVTYANAWSVTSTATINVLAYIVGRALGRMCRAAAEGQLQALRHEYHRLFHYLHGQTENTLAAISWHYGSDRKDLVLATLHELTEAINRERISLVLTESTVSLSTILNLHARNIAPGSILVRLPRIGGVTVPREVGVLVSDILGDLLKNVIRHSGAAVVTIDFAMNHDVARISVADDGVGFDTALLTKGSSLSSLRRLIQASGGDLRLVSRPGAGTTAIATIPVLST